MNAVEFIRQSVEMGTQWALGPITDMKDDPLRQPTPAGGNHPTWLLGHLIYSESDIVDGLLKGQPNRFPEWKDLFGMGTTPTQEAGKYPTIDDMLPKLESLRADTLAYLDTLSDEDLDKPTHAPAEMPDFVKRVGGCLMILVMHTTWHAGQAADCRRAAGRPPMMG